MGGVARADTRYSPPPYRAVYSPTRPLPSALGFFRGFPARCPPATTGLSAGNQRSPFGGVVGGVPAPHRAVGPGKEPCLGALRWEKGAGAVAWGQPWGAPRVKPPLRGGPRWLRGRPA